MVYVSMLLAVAIMARNVLADEVQVDSCTISGNGHIQTLDGSRYDLHGSGALSALSNEFLDYQIELQPTDTVNHSYVRRSTVSVKGDGICHAADCPNRHTVIITYGMDVVNATNPDLIYVTFHHANDTSANFQTQLPISDLHIGLDASSSIANAMNKTGVVLRVIDNVTLSVELDLDLQAPIVISMGPAYTAISTEALGGALSGANGICGLYSRTAVDDFGGALLGARADFYSNVKITDWAQRFARSPLQSSSNQSDAAVVSFVATTLITVPNHVEFWSMDTLMSALNACPGTNGNVTFRLCVRDYVLPSGAILSRSNYDVVRVTNADVAYIRSQSPTATTPTIVERRESAKTSTTVAVAISTGLGAACVLGLIANRRLRQQQSAELTRARASAIRLADKL